MTPELYRVRLIPSETILLHDRILFCNAERIMTSWKTLKPRRDFSTGDSCYFLKDGYKVSRMYDSNGNLVYYYCDIIDPLWTEENRKCFVTDLLADVVVYPNGSVKVLDLGEIADAMDEGLLTAAMAKLALRRLEALLSLIYAGNFSELLKYF